MQRSREDSFSGLIRACGGVYLTSTQDFSKLGDLNRVGDASPAEFFASFPEPQITKINAAGKGKSIL
jgi:hypothetical protein